jgi:hypothetical protein
VGLHCHATFKDKIDAVADVFLLVNDLVLGELALFRVLNCRPHKLVALTLPEVCDLLNHFAEGFDENSRL